MAPKRGKTYRTANGKNIDFGAMILANETAPALGNMNVNARGDQIDKAGNITKSREDIMREYHKLNTMIPEDGAIRESSAVEADDDDWKDWEAPKETVAETKEEEITSTTGGLAAAIAATKE
tara:strand:- start:2202 stop:2567 length:366 start_codon:yes stop_codon:yes gene_type:complete